MKNIYIALFLLLSQAAIAQVPQAINYQGVARNNSGAVLSNQNISLRLSIIDSTGGSGTVEYSELQLVQTNQFGLFTVKVGRPTTVVSGTFSGINWGNTNKYIMVELDPAGGSSFTNMGTEPLLSVPFALAAGSKVGFSAGYSAATTGHASGDTVVVPFDVVAFNDGNGYNPSTGVFTAPEAGVYQFTANMSVPSVCGTGYVSLSLEKNNHVAAVSNISSSEYLLMVSSSLQLTAGDQVKVVETVHCSNNMQVGDVYPAANYFTGVKVY